MIHCPHSCPRQLFDYSIPVGLVWQNEDIPFPEPLLCKEGRGEVEPGKATQELLPRLTSYLRPAGFRRQAPYNGGRTLILLNPPSSPFYKGRTIPDPHHFLSAHPLSLTRQTVADPPSPRALRRAPQRGGITRLGQIILDKSAPDPLKHCDLKRLPTPFPQSCPLTSGFEQRGNARRDPKQSRVGSFFAGCV